MCIIQTTTLLREDEIAATTGASGRLFEIKIARMHRPV
jgi:hypothetical protein